MKNLAIHTLLALFLFACASAPEGKRTMRVDDAAILHRSIKQITDIMVHDIFSPPVASRIYTYVSVGAYEAAIAGSKEYRSLAGQLKGLTPLPKPEEHQEYSYELASIQALLIVGRALVFSEDKLDSYYQDIMTVYEENLHEDVYDRSVVFGTAVAKHILEWAAKDNYKQSRSFPKYSIDDDPATWKPTPPAYMDAIEPHWNKIRTLVIDSAGQFKPAPPTRFSTDKESQFFKEAREVYEITKEMTEEQRSIAFFWDCNPFMMNVKGHVMFATKKISPGGHWMNITRVACKKTNADFSRSAEAYARLSIGLSDAFISCWDEKYRSRLIRPETYINEYIDEDWLPLLQTPPFPEYTSGHSVISTASAVVLTDLFGDNFAFVDSTEIEFGLEARKFASFEKAAEEAAVSRIYGGIHYRPAVEQGVVEGRVIGDYILKRLTTREKEVLAGK